MTTNNNGDKQSPSLKHAFTQKQSDPVSKNELDGLKAQRAKPEKSLSLTPGFGVEKNVHAQINVEREKRIQHIEKRLQDAQKKLAPKRNFTKVRGR